MENTAFWSDCERHFQALHEEQFQDRSHGGLHAAWRSEAWDPANGNHWCLSGGTDRRRTQFEWLAEGAAKRLGHSGGPTAVFFWLDLLKAESPDYQPSNSKLFVKDKKEVCYEHGMIEFVCRASAEYCLKCAAQQAAGKPTPRRDSSPDIQGRRRIVYENSMRRASDLCHLFDIASVPLPKSMSEARSWVRAYRAPTYTHSIDSLICRDRKYWRSSRSHA